MKLMNKKGIFAAAAVLLLAAALFVGAGAAADVQVGTFAELQTYLTSTSTDTAKLTADIPITDAIIMETVTGAKTLELNGHTITVYPKTDGTAKSSQQKVGRKTFYIYQSSLTIKGPGKICDTDGANAAVLRVYGSQTTSAPSTTLTIRDGVTVESNGNGPVGVYSDAQGGFFVASSVANAYNVAVNVTGSTLSSNNQSAATINGQIHNTAATDSIVITFDKATVFSKNGVAIYGAGVGKWVIQNGSNVSGATGIYSKAGEISVSNSNVTATGKYKYPVGVDGGFEPTGDAIVIDSKAGYAGKVTLTVSGNSSVTSINGYAVQECKTDGTETVVVDMELTGGTFKGGKDGIVTTQDLKDKAGTTGYTVKLDGAEIHQNNMNEVPDQYYATPVQKKIVPFTPGSKEGATKVTANFGAEYDLTIPQDFTLVNGKTYHDVVKLGFTVASEVGINVKVSQTGLTAGAEDFKLTKKEGSEVVLFNIGKDNNLTEKFGSGDKLFAVAPMSGTADTNKVDLYFALTANQTITKAGSYEGTLTFVAGPDA